MFVPSINDVARLAGVSTATVSRTFREPSLINAQTQKRVLDVARELNYEPRRARAPRKSSREQTAVATAIGFQFFASSPGDALLSNMFYAPVLAGAQAEAAAQGLHLLIHATDRSGLSHELPKMVQDRAVDGMLLVGTADPSILDTFARHIPQIVLVDNQDPTGRFESVVSDGFGGTYTATHHLMALGHERIGFFPAEADVASFQDRLHGYLCAHHDTGRTPDLDLVVRGRALSADDERAEALAALLASPRRPTALVTANDHYALLAYGVCRHAGIRIPDDVSIVGFDDIVFSRHAEPPLTTVRVEKEFMGRLAVRLLHARLQSGSPQATEAEPAICHHTPVALIQRQSCRTLETTRSENT
jgi:LacI family repressor for deo operon, udp, cdd, tsx, nupC, and nupG